MRSRYAPTPPCLSRAQRLDLGPKEKELVGANRACRAALELDPALQRMPVYENPRDDLRRSGPLIGRALAPASKDAHRPGR